MASKKPQRRTDIRQPLLIVYVSVCVIAVVLTLVIAFSDALGPGHLAQPTSTPTHTLAPSILTLQAEGSMNQDHYPGTPVASPLPATDGTVTPTVRFAEENDT